MWKSEDNINNLTTTPTSHHHINPYHHHQSPPHLSHHHVHPFHHHTSNTSSSSAASTMSQMPISISASTESNSSSSGHSLGRKKRRGMIEKRRRDRINNSLNELRRLVPAAFEKQGSAKLEKAEILQMTVDHLTMLHAKGFDAFSFDPHKFAMDYHAIGFRECASEVARWMVTSEGIDLQDPLRLRLMAHLQCYAAQREMSLKSSASVTSWNPSAFTTPTHSMASSASMPPPPPPPPSITEVNNDHWSTIGPVGHHHHHPYAHHHSQMIGVPTSASSSSETPSTPTSSSSSASSLSSPTVTSLSNGQSYFTYPGSSVKHYRPWGGTELAY